MFTGIIEAMAKLRAMKPEGMNIHFQFEAPFTAELRVDQSIAHNGVCLTVTAIEGQTYWVTAIDETLQLTNLGNLEVNDEVNVERCPQWTDRIDGHIVQGHVDGTGGVHRITEKEGSWVFEIAHQLDHRMILHKGSITINGVSLTVIHSEKGKFAVAIIPHTFKMTSFGSLEVGDQVNLELDVLGKYVKSLLQPS